MMAPTLTARLVDGLYTEAMLLADETQAGFEQAKHDLPLPHARVELACEALKATTRLMQVVAWLLTRKALAAGELERDGARARRRLGQAPGPDSAALAALPAEARRLVEAGADLYERVRRLDEDGTAPEPPTSPARSLFQRLERSI